MNKFDTIIGIVKLIKNQLLSSNIDNQKQCVQYVKKAIFQAGASENIVICMFIRENVTDFLCHSMGSGCDLLLRDVCQCLMMFARYKWFYEIRGRCKSLVASDVLQCVAHTLSLLLKQRTPSGTILHLVQLLHYVLDRISKRNIQLKEICDTRHLLSIGIILLNTKSRCLESGIKLLLHLLGERDSCYDKCTLRSLISIHLKHINDMARLVELTHFSLICLDVITTHEILSSRLSELVRKNVIFIILPGYQDVSNGVKHKILQCVSMFYRLKYYNQQLSMSLVFNDFLIILPQLSSSSIEQKPTADVARNILTEIIYQLSIIHLPVDKPDDFKKQLYKILTNIKSNSYEQWIIELLERAATKERENTEYICVSLVLLYFYFFFVSNFENTDCTNECLSSLLLVIRNLARFSFHAVPLILMKTLWFNLAICVCKMDKRYHVPMDELNTFIDVISDNYSQSLNILISNHPVLLYFTFNRYIHSVKFQVNFIIRWLEISSDVNEEESYRRLLKFSLTNESFRFAILTIIAGYKSLYSRLSVKVLDRTSHLLSVMIQEKSRSSFIIGRIIWSAISDNLLLLSNFIQEQDKLTKFNLIWLLKSLDLGHRTCDYFVTLENVITMTKRIVKVIGYLSTSSEDSDDDRCLLLLLLRLLSTFVTTNYENYISDVSELLIVNKNFSCCLEWLINNGNTCEEIRGICFELCHMITLNFVKKRNDCHVADQLNDISVSINWTTVSDVTWGTNMRLIVNLIKCINTLHQCNMQSYVMLENIPPDHILSLVARLLNIFTITDNQTILSCLRNIVCTESVMMGKYSDNIQRQIAVGDLVRKHVVINNLPWVDGLTRDKTK